MCDKNLFTLIVVLVFACIRIATGLARIRVATGLACARALAFFGADLGFFTFFEEIHRDNRAHRNHDQCGDNTAHYRTDVRLFAGRRRRGVGRNRIAARVCRRNHIVGGDYHVLGLNYLNALLGALLLNAGGYVRNLQHVAVCRRRFALTVQVGKAERKRALSASAYRFIGYIGAVERDFGKTVAAVRFEGIAHSPPPPTRW